MVTLLTLLLLQVVAQPLTVVDAESGEPIENVSVMNGIEFIGFTDSNGQIEIKATSYPVVLSHVAYTSKELRKAVDIARLTPKFYSFKEEIIVTGSNGNDRSTYRQSADIGIEHAIHRHEGVQLIKRGSFASEVQLRGSNEHQSDITIDNMRVFKACVDNMDPVTSYIESDNIEKISIDQSGNNLAANGNGIGSVDLSLRKPSFTTYTTLSQSLQTNDWHRRSSLVLNSYKGSHAVRINASYKTSESFYDGNNSRVSGSQYEKVNLYLGYRSVISKNHIIDLSYIYDRADDVGYPVLLMDAQKAIGTIFRFNYEWLDPSISVISSIKSSFYGNMIKHTMSDYNRDVANRAVMRNMNMPMYGETTTVGSFTEVGLGSHWNLFLEAYHSNAFGDMEMISLDPSIPDMYLLNLADIKTDVVRIGNSIEIGDRWRWRLSTSFGLKAITIGDRSMENLFENMFDKEIDKNPDYTYSISTGLERELFNHIKMTLTYSFYNRLPNHIERFGHYIYNYVDDHFYNGNPWLKNEVINHVEMSLSKNGEKSSGSVSFYYRTFNNYISGRLNEILSSEFYRFKNYDNLGKAITYGVDTEYKLIPIDKLQISQSVSYQFGELKDMRDPMPMIYPFSGITTISYQNLLKTSITADWAFKQKRISKLTSTEDATNSYMLIHLDLSKKWLNKKLEIRIRVQNVFDTYVVKHTSINNLPEIGRAVMLTLRYQI